eukprot:13857397-Alexandrium_andersonii.AAC.1
MGACSQGAAVMTHDSARFEVLGLGLIRVASLPPGRFVEPRVWRGMWRVSVTQWLSRQVVSGVGPVQFRQFHSFSMSSPSVCVHRLSQAVGIGCAGWRGWRGGGGLSLIHISEPTRLALI